MLIAEFARATGLSRDTIRFYVRKGLLLPAVGRSGTNRYQDFDDEQVERALLIREAQALGFTLREISALSDEYARGDLTMARQAELMRERLAAVDEQAARLARLRRYFADKLAWLDAGAIGAAPAFSTGGGACRPASRRRARSNRDAA
ncbi:MAG: MerR family transcriptional regulator [Xanthomonadaceae bacterium]|nr:MerR family transcriptional regulator [Xanthomonadaceae bacterium]